MRVLRDASYEGRIWARWKETRLLDQHMHTVQYIKVLLGGARRGWDDGSQASG